MKGEAAVLVTKQSATNGRYWENGTENICAIDRTHSEMVRFRLQDDEYDKVRGRVRRLAQRALTVRNRIQAKTKCM